MAVTPKETIDREGRDVLLAASRGRPSAPGAWHRTSWRLSLGGQPMHTKPGRGIRTGPRLLGEEGGVDHGEVRVAAGWSGDWRSKASL